MDVDLVVVDIVDGVLGRVVLMVDIPFVDPDVIIVDIKLFVVEGFVVLVGVVDCVEGLTVVVDCAVLDMVDGVLGRDVLMVDVPLVDPDVIIVDVEVFLEDGFIVTVGVVDRVEGLTVAVGCAVVDMVDVVFGRIVLIVEVPLVDPEVIEVDVEVFVVDVCLVIVGFVD